MLSILKELCALFGPSGNEQAVRDYIISHLPNDVEYNVDPLGNLIVHKLGKTKAKYRVMLDAHMDEVGFIITGITPSGMLRFTTVGGITKGVMLSRRVLIDGCINGVICTKPIHQLTDDERGTMPDIDNLYIDIGACSIAEANKHVRPGSTAVFNDAVIYYGNSKIIAKAIDDRVGCAILLDLLNSYSEYDYYVTFSVQEEVGLRGAKTAAYAVNPDYAIVVEGTTAADIADVPKAKQVCVQGDGCAVSYMDSATLYDTELYNTALSVACSNGIMVQTKTLPSGGNNAGAIHLSRGGVKTLALSVPCRYIHSSSSSADINDIVATRALCEAMLKRLVGGILDD